MYINLGERLNDEFYGDNLFKDIANTYIQSLYDANYDCVEINHLNFVKKQFINITKMMYFLNLK